MNRALYAAATGMAAQQRNLDTIADNLANADVAGFKGSTQRFAELAAPGRIGVGTASLGAQVLFAQGRLEKSGGPCDLALDGPGFFAVGDRRGRTLYTRGGSFSRTADGHLRDALGRTLLGIRIPKGALSLHVDANGSVRIRTAQGARFVGVVRVADFADVDALRRIDGSTFAATRASGPARTLPLGGAHAGAIRFGMLERSNVTIVESMMELLAAQRAYEANAKGVQAADELMRIANNLNRG